MSNYFCLNSSCLHYRISWKPPPFFLSDTETSEKIQGSGILELFANLLTPQSSCTAKVANIIAEVAKNGEVFIQNFPLGTSSVLHLNLSVCFIVF